MTRSDKSVFFPMRNIVFALFVFGFYQNGEAQDASGLLWSEIKVQGPPARCGHAMTYEANREQVLLFGGMAEDKHDGEAYFRDTWVFDGSAWSQVSDIGPSPRREFALVYDSWRGKSILFGGQYLDRTVTYDDTWEWDGTQWIQLEVPGPSARYGHAMAFDNQRGKVVLFGGKTIGDEYPYKTDVWEFDGTQWEQVSNPLFNEDSVPYGCIGVRLVYDETRRKTILTGGCRDGNTGTNWFAGNWVWDGNRWETLFFPGGYMRYNHGVAYDSQKGVVVFFGGVPLQGETQELQGDWFGETANSLLYDQPEKIADGPSPRSLHTMTYDSHFGSVILFGGLSRDDNALGDTWKYMVQGKTTQVDHAILY